MTPSRHKEKFAQPKSAACPVGIILPMRQPLVQLCVQLGVQCSYVCSRECSQLRNRSALTTAGRQPAAKKNDLRGRPRTTTSPLNFIFLLFFRLLGQRRSGKASVNRVTRTRPADAMRKTPRKLHAAPFWRRVRADMSDVRVRGRTEIPLAASLPVRQTPPLGFFTRFPLSLSCRAKRCKSPMSEEARRGNILQIGRAENMTSPWSNHFLFFLRVEIFSPKNMFFCRYASSMTLSKAWK